MDKLRKVPAWCWVLVFGAAIAFMRVGGGFWEPWELKIAEQAHAIANSSNLFDAAAGSKYPAAMPLQYFFPALGLKLLGTGELGARIFITVSAIVALFGVYWAGLGLFRRRAALLSVLALGTMSMFVLEARQLASDMPLIAALAWAIGGLGRWAWPPDGKRRGRDLGIAVVALGISFLSAGAAIGLLAPILALVAAILVGFGLRPVQASAWDEVQDGSRELCEPGVGPDQPADRTLGSATLRGRFQLVFWALIALAVGLAVATFARPYTAGKLSVMLGGIPRSGAASQMFEVLVRQLGFGLFPWSALAVFALARPLIRVDEADGGKTNGRLAFAQLLMLFATAFGFALSTYYVLMVGDARFVMLPPIALALGTFLDEALEGQHSEPVVGLIAATGTMLVARDIFMDPTELVSVHLLNKVRWPQSVSIGYGVLVVGLIVGAGIYSGLAARGRALGRLPGGDAAQTTGWRRLVARVTLHAGRWGLQAAVACAVLFALFTSQYLLPVLSKHFSMKPVLDSYTRFAKQGEEVGKYRIEAQGSAFLGGRTLTDLKTQDQLLAFLRKPDRVFAMVPTEDLASLDAAFKLARIDYTVLDAASSKFLLISNRLGSGEQDQNPLKKDVWMVPEFAERGGEFRDDDQVPWKWRIRLNSSFDGGKIELVGANFPETIRRPGKVPLELFFRVKMRPPAGYKIFVHFDGPATPRVIGDHDPLGKMFPTTYWYPGEYIRDRFDVDVPLMTTPAGRYTIYIGFWPGGEGKRLKVTGENDGADRVRVGTLEIK